MMGDLREEDRERSPLHELPTDRGGIGGLFDLSESTRRDKFRTRGRKTGNVGLAGSGRTAPLVGLVYFSTDNDTASSYI